MLYRLKKGFFPPKGLAAFLTFVFIALAIWAWTAGGELAMMWTPGLLIFALWYGGVWLYKINRDRKIAERYQPKTQQNGRMRVQAGTVLAPAPVQSSKSVLASQVASTETPRRRSQANTQSARRRGNTPKRLVEQAAEPWPKMEDYATYDKYYTAYIARLERARRVGDKAERCRSIDEYEASSRGGIPPKKCAACGYVIEGGYVKKNDQPCPQCGSLVDGSVTNTKPDQGALRYDPLSGERVNTGVGGLQPVDNRLPFESVLDGLSKLSDKEIEILRERIGDRIAEQLVEQLTDTQFDELMRFLEVTDEAGVTRWLDTNYADIVVDIVVEEYGKFKRAIADNPVTSSEPVIEPVQADSQPEAFGSKRTQPLNTEVPADSQPAALTDEQAQTAVVSQSSSHPQTSEAINASDLPMTREQVQAMTREQLVQTFAASLTDKEAALVCAMVEAGVPDDVGWQVLESLWSENHEDVPVAAVSETAGEANNSLPPADNLVNTEVPADPQPAAAAFKEVLPEPVPVVAQPYKASASVEAYLYANFGYHPETGDQFLIRTIERYAGTYILGVQGYGKSSLLQNLIVQDMQDGHAVIVIDPHGDLTQNCIGMVPPTRLLDTYLLDIQDEGFPFGVNLFGTGRLDTDFARTQAVERIMHVFKVLWPEVVSQANLPNYLRNAIIALLANPGTTLVDMHAFLKNQSYRTRLLTNAPADVRQFWQTDYDNLSEHDRKNQIRSLMTRLNALFTGRTLIRNIVGQSRTTINFRKAIEEKQIIFIKLPVKQIEQDASLIGTILLAQIHAAIFSFADIPEAQRPGFSLFVDEFQHFATPDFSEMLTEGRKFGVRVTVAHQQRSQLPDFLQKSTETTRTKVCFRLTHEDSQKMAHYFPSNEATILPEDIEVHPSRYLLNHPSDNRDNIWLFTEYYLHPLQGYKRGAGSVEIERWKIGGPQLDAMITGDFDNPRVADPTHRLDSLLYEVMRTGNPDLPIPPEVVDGFSNCGIGFYKEAKRLGYNDPRLQADTKFPRHLVVEGPDGGLHWTRQPETGKEQMLHFIFHLRCVMQQLAQNPIGKATTVSTADVANMLMNLPKRAALVRSDDNVGKINTHDTLTPVSSAELADRRGFIMGQTRATYCKPRPDVERGLQGLPDEPPEDEPPEESGGVPAEKPPKQPPDQPMGRWEELE